MQNLDGVLFDKDGTLFDFQATWGAWCRTFLGDLAAGDSDRITILGTAIGFDTATGRFLPGSPVVADTPDVIAAHLIGHLTGWSASRLVDHMNAVAETVPQIEVVPLAPLLDGLRARGLVLGLVTNDGEGPARAHLEQAGILQRFDFISGFDSGHGGKPEPGPLLAFARATGLAPGRVAMVGDSPHDMVAGRAAGMVCVAVGTGVCDAVDLMPLADVFLPDIGALPAWIDGQTQETDTICRG